MLPLKFSSDFPQKSKYLVLISLSNEFNSALNYLVLILLSI